MMMFKSWNLVFFFKDILSLEKNMRTYQSLSTLLWAKLEDPTRGKGDCQGVENGQIYDQHNIRNAEDFYNPFEWWSKNFDNFAER